MNQKQRDQRAIRTVLTQMGYASYPDIALRAGEGLLQTLWEMVVSGEVIREKDDTKPVGRRVTYRLKEAA